MIFDNFIKILLEMSEVSGPYRANYIIDPNTEKGNII